MGNQGADFRPFVFQLITLRSSSPILRAMISFMIPVLPALKRHCPQQCHGAKLLSQTFG